MGWKYENVTYVYENTGVASVWIWSLCMKIYGLQVCGDEAFELTLQSEKLWCFAGYEVGLLILNFLSYIILSYFTQAFWLKQVFLTSFNMQTYSYVLWIIKIALEYQENENAKTCLGVD